MINWKPIADFNESPFYKLIKSVHEIPVGRIKKYPDIEACVAYLTVLTSYPAIEKEQPKISVPETFFGQIYQTEWIMMRLSEDRVSERLPSLRSGLKNISLLK